MPRPPRVDEPTPYSGAVLSEVGPSLLQFGRVVLCQIVRVGGSTPGKPGWRLLLRPDGHRSGNLGGGAFEALVETDAEAKLTDAKAESEVKRYYLTETAKRGEPTGMVCGGFCDVFLEVLELPPVLVICGGGPVGQAVARAGALAGFELGVVEDRAEFRAAELFPGKTKLIAVDRAFTQAYLEPWQSRQLYVTLVSRCWETDAAALASLLEQKPPGLCYVGLMGSQRKVDRVVAEVEKQGLEIDVPFFAPIGLGLGGDSPGEIAISIVAQLLDVRHRDAALSRRTSSDADAAEGQGRRAI